MSSAGASAPGLPASDATNEAARRISWSASSGSAVVFVRTKRTAPSLRKIVVAAVPSAQTRKPFPETDFLPRYETAKDAVSTAPMRMPRDANGASQEATASSGAATAITRVPAAPGPAVCHTMRSGGAGSPYVFASFQERISSVSFGAFSGSSTSITRTWTKSSGTASDATDGRRPASSRTAPSARASSGPATGLPHPVSVNAPAGSGRANVATSEPPSTCFCPFGSRRT